jgi:hypothetical protein
MIRDGVEYVLVPVEIARAVIHVPGSVYGVAGVHSLCQFCPYSYAQTRNPGTCQNQCKDNTKEYTDHIYVDKPTAVLMVLEGS